MGFMIRGPFFFPTGLVRLYIAGLRHRSCCTIRAPSVQGSAQCAFFRFWLQQNSNPHHGAFHADVLPLRHFDPPFVGSVILTPRDLIIDRTMETGGCVEILLKGTLKPQQSSSSQLVVVVGRGAQFSVSN